MNSKLLTITDICNELHIGKSTAYQLIKSKELKSVKLGRRILVRNQDLDEFISNKLST